MDILFFAFTPDGLFSTSNLLAARLPPGRDLQLLVPIGRIFLQHLASKNTVAGSILNVNMEIAALHRDHKIHVQLQCVRNALLHAECMGRSSGKPSRRFGPAQIKGDNNQGNSPWPSRGSTDLIGSFRFGCEGG